MYDYREQIVVVVDRLPFVVLRIGTVKDASGRGHQVLPAEPEEPSASYR